jgi:hypothetical protein
VLGIVAELGVRLEVRGRNYFPLPWRLVSAFPPFNNVLPVRLSMFVALAASVCVAWWASSQNVPRAARVALTAVTIATVVPSLWLSVWHEHPFRPSFFAQGVYRACLGPSDNVLMLPFPSRSDAMLWQAEAHFAYHMATGYVGPASPPGVPDPRLVLSLEREPLSSDRRPLIAWVRHQRVTEIVAAGKGARAWVRLLAPVARASHIMGVYLYKLRPNRGSACPSGSAWRPADP